MRYTIDGIREGYPSREPVPTDCIRELAQKLNRPVYYCHRCRAIGHALAPLLPAACICCALPDTQPDSAVICRQCCSILTEYVYSKVGGAFESNFDLPILLREGAQERLLIDLRIVPKIGQQLIMQCVVQFMLSYRHPVQNVILVIAHGSVQVRTLEWVLATFWTDQLMHTGVSQINIGAYLAVHEQNQTKLLAHGDPAIYRAAIDHVWASIVAGTHRRLGLAAPRMRISTPVEQRVLCLKRGLPCDKVSLWAYLQQLPPYTGTRVWTLLHFYATVYPDLFALAAEGKLFLLPMSTTCAETVYVRVVTRQPVHPTLLHHWRAAVTI